MKAAADADAAETIPACGLFCFCSSAAAADAVSEYSVISDARAAGNHKIPRRSSAIYVVMKVLQSPLRYDCKWRLSPETASEAAAAPAAALHPQSHCLPGKVLPAPA